MLVVHRPAYGDWTFPKGKCERGESDEDCALREVEEETGLVCELERRAALDLVPRRARPAEAGALLAPARRRRRGALRPRGRRGALGDARPGGVAAHLRARPRRAASGRLDEHVVRLTSDILDAMRALAVAAVAVLCASAGPASAAPCATTPSFGPASGSGRSGSACRYRRRGGRSADPLRLARSQRTPGARRLQGLRHAATGSSRSAILGPRENARVARIVSTGRAETRGGVGVGSDVAAVKRELLPFESTCRANAVFLNYKLHGRQDDRVCDRRRRGRDRLPRPLGSALSSPRGTKAARRSGCRSPRLRSRASRSAAMGSRAGRPCSAASGSSRARPARAAGSRCPPARGQVPRASLS